MSSIELKSRAKINLSIDVLGKREDGYHLVEMIMQTIDLYDIIKIKEIEIDEININSNSSDIPLNENNIVYKAAKVLKDQFNIKNRRRLRPAPRHPEHDHCSRHRHSGRLPACLAQQTHGHVYSF